MKRTGLDIINDQLGKAFSAPRMKTIITCTNGTSANLIKGSRIRLYSYDETKGEFNWRKAKVLMEISVSSKNGIKYCEDNPDGVYGKRYAAMLDLQRMTDEIEKNK